MTLIGKPIPRVEDLRLVAGKGRYTDDIRPDGACWMVVLRSPHAHAAIRAIRTDAAKSAPGVRAVLTAADYRADGLKGVGHVPIPADAKDASKPAFTATADAPIFDHPHLPLAEDRVRHIGEGVTAVIADTLAQARDAAELIEVEYEPLPAVTSPSAAIAKDAPQLWPAAPGNLCFRVPFGDEAATAGAFAKAAVVVKQDFQINRVFNAQMEPRSALGEYDPQSGVYTLTTGSQGVIRLRMSIAQAFGVSPDKVRVVTPDVGGGFGPRSNVYTEQVLVAWAARRVGRPVRWVAERSEGLLTDYAGRDLLTRAEMAFASDGRILGLRAALYGNVGAHSVTYVPLSNGYRIISTVYDVPVHAVTLHGVLTNTAPTAPYRGAGRPEATFVMERLLDIAARRLNMDRVEMRRRNLVPKAALPYRNVTGLVYDSGDFHRNMDAALARADWKGFPARAAESRKRNRLRGIGLANYIESPVGAPREKVIVTVRPDDTVEIVAGTQSTGQGHETTFAQVMADRLGVPFESIKLVTGDTKVVAVGGGTHSDRSMRLGGTLLVQSADKIIADARERLGGRCEFADGLFRLPDSNRTMTVFDVARAHGALTAEAEFNGRIPAFPTGCAVCELEVDPETGTVEIVRYTSVDDVGQAINPLIVDGQVHGGIVQGVGQALTELVAYDNSGQVLTGSFMDYGLPRADMFPRFDVEMTEDPTAGNPLRVKGGGESGITPSLATVINALCDALSVYGIEHIDMPATAQRIWATIQNATKKQN